jgi:hypothetical protein
MAPLFSLDRVTKLTTANLSFLFIASILRIRQKKTEFCGGPPFSLDITFNYAEKKYTLENSDRTPCTKKKFERNENIYVF